MLSRHLRVIFPLRHVIAVTSSRCRSSLSLSLLCFACRHHHVVGIASHHVPSSRVVVTAHCRCRSRCCPRRYCRCRHHQVVALRRITSPLVTARVASLSCHCSVIVVVVVGSSHPSHRHGRVVVVASLPIELRHHCRRMLSLSPRVIGLSHSRVVVVESRRVVTLSFLCRVALRRHASS